ncbi:MAG: 4a-hydroxytetrahydrobiopterin dehydratase [Actinomycetota bacterium]|jgi:4a-hydroxytetrahydrobiopterin dehydratase
MAWETVDGRLQKVVEKKDFAEALAYVNAVGEVAEAANHHPDIAISWNTVTLTLFTHDAGAITDADHAMARQLDDLD